MRVIHRVLVIVLLQPIVTFGQKDGSLFRLEVGTGVGYGAVTGSRSRTCSQQVPGPNTSYLLCGSENASTLFPHFRLGARILPSNIGGLFAVAGVEGLDRRSKSVFQSNSPDTLDYVQYVTKHPQLNSFFGIGKELGRLEVVINVSMVLVEYASYFRWTPNGDKEEWLDSQRVKRGFRIRPQLLLSYVLFRKSKDWRAFLAADLRERADANKNVIDTRLGFIYSF